MKSIKYAKSKVHKVHKIKNHFATSMLLDFNDFMDFIDFINFRLQWTLKTFISFRRQDASLVTLQIFKRDADAFGHA